MKIPIKIDFLKTNIDILILPDKAYKKYLDKFFNGDETVLAFTADTLIVFKESQINYGILAHQIYHLVHNILSYRRIEDQETYAYMIQFITEKVTEKYKIKCKK